jgi:hypothetical protein
MTAVLLVHVGIIAKMKRSEGRDLITYLDLPGETIKILLSG